MAVSEAGINDAEVRLKYKVVTNILSAKGSKNDPSLEACPGTFLAIHPSSWLFFKVQSLLFNKMIIYTFSYQVTKTSQTKDP